jgi:mRNA interferase MazF
MENDFDHWNKIKKTIDSMVDALGTFPNEGEVWISIIGKNIGFEQNGSNGDFSRPVLVVKKFNNNMFWCVPLSTKQKSLDFYFNYTDPNNQKVSAILAQMRLISVKRFKRKIYDIDNSLLKDIKNGLALFCK